MKKALTIFGLITICFTACKNKKEVSAEKTTMETEKKSTSFPSTEKSMMTLSK